MVEVASEHVYSLGCAFYRVAREHADRTALSYPSGEKLTYAELNSVSNRMARALLELGVGPGDVVCLFSNKSPHALAAVLACLKIGAPYTNLDVSSPWQRIQKMLERCNPRLVLHDHEAEALDQVRSMGTRVLDLGSRELLDLVAVQSPEDLSESRIVTGSHPAYIMFTSGSTGFPKGAVMSHANVLGFIQWAQATLDVTPADVFTNVNPIYFDNSVFDLYSSLFSGASLCPVTTDLAKQPADLVRSVNELGCTIWFSVPSMLVYLLTTKALKGTDLPNIQHIVFGGEGFPKSKLRDLYDLFGDRATLVNVYGPTECTCICSSYVITRQDVDNQDELAPLGEIAPNFGYLIDPVDDEDPDFGELLLSGPNVGLGYYDDEERTRQAFVQDPSQDRYRSIMYRTGDLVRRAPNGHLHFCGRADNQIKHMGYRIELEEIEAGFSSLGYVDEVAVVYKRVANGLGQIVAFVSCAEADQKRLSGDIQEVVAPYMVPKRIHVLDVLPKNANGKIDRTRLKEMA